MPSNRLSTLLASAALVLGVVLVPASAYADDPAPTGAFTNADLTAALSAAQAPTAAAGRGGWAVQGTGSVTGSPAVTVKAIYAVDRALTSSGPGETIVEAERSGTYLSTAAFETFMPKIPVRRALKAIAKPHATWVFTRERSLDLSDPEGDSAIVSAAPEGVLRALVDPKQTRLTGTPTTSAASDGSTTYSFAATDLTEDDEAFTGTLTVDARGVLTAAHSVAASYSYTLTYAYGAQQVTLPVWKKTVTALQLGHGFALAVMPWQAKSIARRAARAATRRHPVTVDAINAAAHKLAKGYNGALGLKVFTTTTIARGARITATNPYTHARISYTVAIAGKKAVVHRA